MTDEQFLDVAASILDGTPVSWDTLPEPETEADRGFLKQLRLLDELTRAHHEAQSPLGTRWGPLLLVERIGSGTFGDVYKARDPALDRDVALKLLRSPTAGRHLAEGRLLARVRHPNVVTVHGAAEHDGVSGIWMEFIQGLTLAQLVAEHGPFAASHVTAIGSDVCRALAAVHASGLLHGDIKAQNVMREDGGRLVLMDFGTGRIAGDAPPAAALAGTPLYVAPEVLKGEPADAVSDIYGVGVLLYFLLTGAFPVEGRTLAEVRAAHASGTRTAIRDRRPDIPRRLAVAIDRATAPTKTERFHTVADLEAAMAERTTTRRWARVAAVAAVSAVVAVGSWMLAARRSAPATATMPSTAPQWVLVVPFENRTSDRQLDGVLEHAVEAELANSPMLKVVPRDRVEDSLRLMRRPLDAKLDEHSSREVSVRDGQIHAMVAGHIEQAGSGLSLTVRVIQTDDGLTLAGITEEAGGATAIAAAVRRVSDRVREVLGERGSAIAHSGALERVTTPSMPALRLYSASYQLGRRRDWPAALELAQQAVAIDASFPSALIWLAWAHHNVNHPIGQYREYAEKAVALSDHTPEAERYWIVGSYHSLVTHNDEKAAVAYEALLTLHPEDHMSAEFGLNNLLVALTRLGRRRDIEPYAAALAASRPRSFELARLAAGIEMNRTHDAARVLEKYGEQFVGQIEAFKDRDDRFAYCWARSLPLYARLRSGDIAGAVAIEQQFLSEAEVDSEVKGEMAFLAVHSALSFGRLGDAGRAVAHLTDDHDPQLFAALLQYYRGDAEGARRTAALQGRTVHERAFAEWLFTKLGLPRRAEATIRAIDPERYFAPGLKAMRADFAIAAGDLESGISTLAETLPALGAGGMRYRFAESLAEALIRRGEIGEALAVLRQTHDLHGYNEPLGLPPFSPYWIADELLLAETYRTLGRRDEAREIVGELTKLLAFADADFAPLLRLRRLEQRLREHASTCSAVVEGDVEIQ